MLCIKCTLIGIVALFIVRALYIPSAAFVLLRMYSPPPGVHVAIAIVPLMNRPLYGLIAIAAFAIGFFYWEFRRAGKPASFKLNVHFQRLDRRTLLIGGDMTQRLAQLVATILLLCATAQAQQCLQSNTETAQEKQRRYDAVNAVRRINTAEFQNKPEAKKFVPFAELVTSATWKKLNGQGPLKLSDGAIGVLPGFELRLTTDGVSYALSLTDKSDPFKFTVFSDDIGIIYTGQPIG